MKTIWDWKDPSLGKQGGLRDGNGCGCEDRRGDDGCEKAKRPLRANHGG
jgi:hypothetical protein